jgi:nitrous oxidase accessory protein
MLPSLLLLVLVAQGAPMGPEAAGTLEGRPPASELSPLQARIDGAAPGATIEVAAGTYQGDLFIDRSVRLVGRGRPRLNGSGRGSVIRIRADGVVIEGFDIDGREGGNLARDSSGVHVAAKNVQVRDCRISGSLFGVYLREADGAVVEDNVIEGIPGRAPGEQGSGIHLWSTAGFRLTRNTIRDSRDGFYIQSSPRGFITRNRVSEVRYAVHYMFSDDNVFEDNVFERSAAGAALMYSRRLEFRRNQFLRNRGFASVGLLLKACDDVVAEDNLIADNARGMFLEGSYRNVIRRNRVVASDIAIVLYDSSHDNRFEDNAFVANLSPLQLVGRRTDTVFDRNYWSDADGADLDGDGFNDREYRLSNVFDHLRGNLMAADLLAGGLGAQALGAAERTFPVLAPIPVVDRHPRTRPPDLPLVPIPAAPSAHGSAWGVVLSAAGLAGGMALLVADRRPRRARKARS